MTIQTVVILPGSLANELGIVCDGVNAVVTQMLGKEQ